jgi:hypothetical protein
VRYRGVAKNLARAFSLLRRPTPTWPARRVLPPEARMTMPMIPAALRDEARIDLET